MIHVTAPIYKIKEGNNLRYFNMTATDLPGSFAPFLVRGRCLGSAGQQLDIYTQSRYYVCPLSHPIRCNVDSKSV